MHILASTDNLKLIRLDQQRYFFFKWLGFVLHNKINRNMSDVLYLEHFTYDTI